MGFTLRITKNLIPQVQGSIVGKSVDAVRDSAHSARSRAWMSAPVDTGAYRASLYVNGPNGESDYGVSAVTAKALNPAANIVPEVQAAHVDPQIRPLRDNRGQFSKPEAVVSSAVEYGLYLEEGTVYMSPRSIIRNAGLQTEQVFKALMSKVADGF